MVLRRRHIYYDHSDRARPSAILSIFLGSERPRALWVGDKLPLWERSFRPIFHRQQRPRNVDTTATTGRNDVLHAYSLPTCHRRYASHKSRLDSWPRYDSPSTYSLLRHCYVPWNSHCTTPLPLHGGRHSP